MGLTDAIAWSQLGILLIGKYALLANISGKVISWKIAWGISILVDRNVKAVNADERPTLIRNTMAKTPKMLNQPKFVPVTSPSANATNATMPAWKIARTLAENTLARMIDDRETGVLKTLFMNPSRLSQTTDMPVNAVVNTVVNATMPIAMKEK